MTEHLDPSLLPVALLIWPATRSLVFIGAAAVNLWSRKPSRRAEARRLLRMIAARDSDEGAS
jgi:hypothetical protein